MVWDCAYDWTLLLTSDFLLRAEFVLDGEESWAAWSPLKGVLLVASLRPLQEWKTTQWPVPDFVSACHLYPVKIK